MLLAWQVGHDKQTSSQRKCREHLRNLPSHHDNVTHQGISISQPCYEDEWMECNQSDIVAGRWEGADKARTANGGWWQKPRHREVAVQHFLPCLPILRFATRKSIFATGILTLDILAWYATIHYITSQEYIVIWMRDKSFQLLHLLMKNNTQCSIYQHAKPAEH